MKTSKKLRREKRHTRIRSHLSGTAKCPRLVVFKSLKKNYAQLIDDEKGVVIAAACDSTKDKAGTKSERAKKVGVDLAKKAIEKGVTACVFDRNGYKYHGRIQALATGAREGGLKF